MKKHLVILLASIVLYSFTGQYTHAQIFLSQAQLKEKKKLEEITEKVKKAQKNYFELNKKMGTGPSLSKEFFSIMASLRVDAKKKVTKFTDPQTPVNEKMQLLLKSPIHFAPHDIDAADTAAAIMAVIKQDKKYEDYMDDYFTTLRLLNFHYQRLPANFIDDLKETDKVKLYAKAAHKLTDFDAAFWAKMRQMSDELSVGIAKYQKEQFEKMQQENEKFNNFLNNKIN
ncbi:hypothetical protein Dip510_001999 [Elusimicrobium posterum]|uniref:hypothetical protein n=1 Tax=Elusimicrobium posterum TaxID=3116653 RepID=UPI003C749DBC